MNEIYEDLDNCLVGCSCTLLSGHRKNREGWVEQVNDNEIVVVLYSGKRVYASRDEVLCYD